MPDDRRAVLEGIAYGNDPKVTPGDRLRALEMLHGGMDADEDAADYIARYVASLSDEQLDRELEGYLNPGQRVPDANAEAYLSSLTADADVRVGRLSRLVATLREQLGARTGHGHAQDEQSSGAGTGKGLVPFGVGLTSAQLAALAAERRREEIEAEVDAEMRGLPSVTSRPCPPGVDPTAWRLFGNAQDGPTFNWDSWD